ncbi:DUF1990 family protein [Streptomyces sp. NPDC008141]|uniref:DUF1990 family protein n=1 Tax=Streptomyces sp. NPDC008141 TaxID=3364815 RepID=UPI0036E332B4
MPSDRSDRPAGSRHLTYAPAGATSPGDGTWTTGIPGCRRYERTVVIGHGDSDWRAAADAVLRWGVKRRSGFRVTPLAGAGERVVEGAEYRITAAWGPVAVHEPVRVVAVVDTADRCGFAYGTLPGHPVSGEEAFVVGRDPDGRVTLTLRSLTGRAPAGPWRTVFPVLLIAQRWYRRRYLRALLHPASQQD